ncbi:MAG: LysR family transcriptional regulator [Massilimicrobiota timonensis]
MEIRILRYFLTVAREENITKAANVLHITQPTLSRQLMQLEEELNTQLLIRGKNKITLTDAGMLLRRRAEEIIDLADKTEKEFLEADELIAGEIFVGAGEINAMHLLGDFMIKFQHHYPQIKYHLYSGNADDVKQKVNQGLLDIGLLTEPVDVEKYDFVRLNYQEAWGILAPKDSAIAKKDYVTPQDLQKLPLLIGHRQIVQNELAHWMGMNVQDLNIVATYDLIYNAAILVEKGLGYALCLDKIVYMSNDSLVRFIPLKPAYETGAVIVWKKHQVFSLTATRFIQEIYDYFH